MKKFITKSNPNYRGVMTSNPVTQREKDFILLWQQKKYKEALMTCFPDKWIWFAEDINKETVCDYPKIAGHGEAMSEPAFNVFQKAFPEETKLNHPFEIDGYKFIWFSPPVIEKTEFFTAEFNIFMVKPLYKTIYSEVFVNLWKEHGFTGHEFVLIERP